MTQITICHHVIDVGLLDCGCLTIVTVSSGEQGWGYFASQGGPSELVPE